MNFSTVEIMKNKPTSISLADFSVTNISVVDCEKNKVNKMVGEKSKTIHESHRHQNESLVSLSYDIKLPVRHLKRQRGQEDTNKRN